MAAEAQVQQARSDAMAAALDGDEQGVDVIQAALDIFGGDLTEEARERAQAYLPPANRDPHSQAAAASMVEAAPTIRERVYDLIVEREAEGKPVATFEIEEVLGLSHQTASPRVYELIGEGRVRRIGEATAPSGRRVWVLGKGTGEPVGRSERLDPLRQVLRDVVDTCPKFTSDRVRFIAEDDGHVVTSEALDDLFVWAQPNLIEPTDEVRPSRYGGEVVVWKSLKFKG